MVTDYVAVPQTLIEANKVITLAADIFFVDGTAFLLTVARRIKFVTAEHVPIRTATSPKQTSQTGIGGVQTCRICSKNYINGQGV